MFEKCLCFLEKGGILNLLLYVRCFLGKTDSRAIGRVMPTYRGGAVRECSLDSVLPSFICDELRRGLVSFERKLSGFSSDDAVLTGVETRTSAPVRILRGEDMRALGKGRVYPCGEGAGYAGGILSAATDGIKLLKNGWIVCKI